MIGIIKIAHKGTTLFLPESFASLILMIHFVTTTHCFLDRVNADIWLLFRDKTAQKSQAYCTQDHLEVRSLDTMPTRSAERIS